MNPISPTTHPFPLEYDTRMTMWGHEIPEGYVMLSPMLMHNEGLKDVCFCCEVPEVLKKRLEPLRTLIVCSFYNYEFLDMALRELIMLFESALRIRHLELEGVKPTYYHSRLQREVDFNFRQLIDWADSKGLLEYSAGWAHGVRKHRNTMFHGDAHHFGGMFYLHQIKSIVDVINGLYLDADERKKRHGVVSRFSKDFIDIYEHGGKLIKGDVEFLIVAGGFWFIQITDDGNILAGIWFLPMFEIEAEGDGSRGSSNAVKEPQLCVTLITDQDQNLEQIQLMYGKECNLSEFMSELQQTERDAIDSWKKRYLLHWKSHVSSVSHNFEKDFARHYRSSFTFDSPPA